jgi:hypothetical protein
VKLPLFVTTGIPSILAILLCFSFSTWFYAQAPYYQKIGSERGLPTSAIYDLFSSKEGHIYLGMEIGLARFNGNSFKTFPIEGNRSRSMNDIQQDAEGKIWCMNFTNQLFYLENDTLRPETEINTVIDGAGLFRAFAIHSKGIYFLTEKALFFQDKSRMIKRIYSIDSTILNNSFVELICSADGEDISIIDDRRVYTFNTNHEVITTQLVKGGQNKAVYFKDQLVVSPKGNINLLRIGKEKVNIAPAFLNVYINHLSATDNELWLCTNTGLIPYEATTNTLTKVYFENTRITDIVKDIDGGYWVSSVDRGLFYIPNMDIRQTKLSDYNAHRICIGPENTIFVGLGNGDIFHLASDKTIIQKLPTKFMSEVEFLFYEEEKNRLLSSHGVYDLNNNYAYVPLRLGKAITADNRGNFLFNTYNKAVLLNRDLKSKPNLGGNNEDVKFGVYSNLNIPFLELYSNRSNDAYFDTSSNTFYIGAFDTLRTVSHTKTEDRILYHGESIVVLHFHESNYGYILLSTQKHGVLRLEKGKVYKHYDEREGLISNTCIKTYERDSLLFILSDRGINMVNLYTDKIANLTANLSLKNSVIFDFAVLDDELALATDVGLLYLTIPKESAPVLPRLNSLSLFRAKEMNAAKESVFTYEDNNLRFVADAIHFQNGGQFMFSYRLKGFDESWQEQLSNDNTFNYLSLPPGSYTFELRTKLNEWYSPIQSINFIITLPFWNTLWFFILLFLCTLFLSYLFFRRILLQQRKKQLINQRLVQSQMVSLRAQMNPHFLFNIVNSVQGLIYSNRKTEASNLLGKMSTLMRSVLEVSDKPNITIQKELDILTTYVELESARFDGDFFYSISSTISVEQQDLLIPSMIIQPFVENAIKHGLLHKTGEKKLLISVENEGVNKIKVIIQDNGIGRKASQIINQKRKNHKSFASDAIDSRISLINKVNDRKVVALNIVDMYDDQTKEPLGTRIEVKINTDETH